MVVDPQKNSPVRVCIIGAESTGKTTLCGDLAEHYGVPFVPEFGRWYTLALPDSRRYRWSADDFRVIAETQNRFEDDALRWAETVVICDTNSYVTEVFEKAYLGSTSAEVRALAAERSYDLFVVTDPGTRFSQDSTGLRNLENRAWMHEAYVEYVAASGTPSVQVGGTPAERLAKAVEAVDAL